MSLPKYGYGRQINTPKKNIEIQLMEVRNNKHKSFLNAIDNKQMYKNEMSEMYDYIAPLLRKEPKYIFLHIGCNDAVSKNSDVILHAILLLKSHIESMLLNAVVYLICPVLRFDNAKAGLTLIHLRSKMKEANLNIIENER